jgi:hypothetical protein
MGIVIKKKGFNYSLAYLSNFNRPFDGQNLKGRKIESAGKLQ